TRWRTQRVWHCLCSYESTPLKGGVDGASACLCRIISGVVADPATRTPAPLDPAPRRHRLFPRPRRLRRADQGSLGALLATTIRASTMDGAHSPAMTMATGCVKCM